MMREERTIDSDGASSVQKWRGKFKIRVQDKKSKDGRLAYLLKKYVK